MKKKGQSLFETVIALVLISSVMVAMISLTTFAVRNNNYAKNQDLADKQISRLIEWIKKEKDNDIVSFKKRTGTYCLTNFTWSQDSKCSSYSQNISLEGKLTPNISNSEMQVDVSAIWTTSQGVIERKSSTIINLKE